MRKYDLGFISDEDIFNHVRETVSRYSTHLNLKAFNKNIIDPIKLTFDAKIYGRSLQDIITNECIRQMDKSNNNHIGYFHQNLFKYAGRGWSVPQSGFDVVNSNEHIYVEMKNKHNTMNAPSSQKIYMKMQSKLLEDDQATCMLVEVIAKKSQNIPWEITLDGRKFNNKNIRRVSIDKFYGLVFDDENAFSKLCKELPVILDDVVTEIKSTDNTVMKELEKMSPDVTKSLYLLAFKTYDGFDNF